MENIGSGNCAVHNTFLLDHPQKSVLYCPWEFRPNPFWLSTLTNMDKVLERVIFYLCEPGLFTVLRLMPEVIVAKY